MIICEQCQQTLDDDSTFCPECGAKAVQMLYCQFCGERVQSDSDFCPECGQKIIGLIETDTVAKALPVLSDTKKPKKLISTLRANGEAFAVFHWETTKVEFSFFCTLALFIIFYSKPWFSLSNLQSLGADVLLFAMSKIALLTFLITLVQTIPIILAVLTIVSIISKTAIRFSSWATGMIAILILTPALFSAVSIGVSPSFSGILAVLLSIGIIILGHRRGSKKYEELNLPLIFHHEFECTKYNLYVKLANGLLLILSLPFIPYLTYSDSVNAWLERTENIFDVIGFSITSITDGLFGFIMFGANLFAKFFPLLFTTLYLFKNRNVTGVIYLNKTGAFFTLISCGVLWFLSDGIHELAISNFVYIAAILCSLLIIASIFVTDAFSQTVEKTALLAIEAKNKAAETGLIAKEKILEIGTKENS